MDGEGGSTHLEVEKEEAEADGLKAKEAAVGLVKEAAEDKEKETEIRVKMVLT